MANSFKIGDLAVYPAHGVVEVVGVVIAILRLGFGALAQYTPM